jgi:hypothetical protein
MIAATIIEVAASTGDSPTINRDIAEAEAQMDSGKDDLQRAAEMAAAMLGR